MASTRIKIISLLSFVAFSLFMFIGFRNYILEKQNSGVEVNIINTKQFIKKSINFLIKEKKLFYLNLSNIIFSDDEIIEALKNKDRERFYKYAKSYYDRLKKREGNFWGMHIILPNNMSFIRVHKPHVADKLIPKGKKPLIDKVNETYQQVTSFDSGKFGYFLRVVTPIFSKDKEYLGVAEFSIKVDSLTQYIKKELGYEALFLVKNKQNKSFLNDLPKTKNGLTIFKSTDESYFKNYSLGSPKGNYLNKSYNRYMGNKNIIFTTVLIKLSDTADLVIAFDLSNILQEQEDFERNVTSLISVVIFIFLIIWFFATKFYIKDKKQAAGKLQKSQDIISKNVIFADLDLSGIISNVSDAFCHVSGYTREQLVGVANDIVGYSDEKNSAENIWKTIKADKTWKGEGKNIKQDGNDYWVNVTISPRFDESNQKIGYTSIKQDITDKKIIEEISITDGLCGIYNRRHFDDQFPKIVNALKRKKELVCFSIMDVDYFKQYNDIYGHQMGDEVLKSIAKTLKSTFKRGDDYCFRLGGEEFGVIFKIEDKERAFEFVNTIRINIENLKIDHRKNDASNYVTASFGVTCKNATDIKNVDEIYKDTDNLLYKAKKSGRNKVMINVGSNK